MKHTQKEIDSNINILENQVDDLARERTALSKTINEKKKQIKGWKELDLSQLKLV